MRVGVVGVGVMGSNHARVFAGLPGAELVGVADPDQKQADFVARTLGCAAVATVEELLDLERRRHHHRRADPSASRYRAGLHRARRPRAGGKADRLDGGRGPRDHRRGAPRRRDADGRPCRALQSGGRGHQGSHPRRGHSVDRHHPRRPVSAAHVECRRGDRSGGARHRPDPLVHRLRHHRSAAAALERGGRARGHRAAAIPHRLRRAGAHQHQLADAVQGAQRHRRHARQIRAWAIC